MEETDKRLALRREESQLAAVGGFLTEGVVNRQAIELLTKGDERQKKEFFDLAVQSLVKGLNVKVIEPRDFSRNVQGLMTLDDSRTPAGDPAYERVIVSLAGLDDEEFLKATQALPVVAMTKLARVDCEVCSPRRMAAYIRNAASLVWNQKERNRGRHKKTEVACITLRSKKYMLNLLLQKACERDEEEIDFMCEVIEYLEGKEWLGKGGYVSEVINELAEEGCGAAEVMWEEIRQMTGQYFNWEEVGEEDEWD